MSELSIIMPAYNAERYIEESVASVLRQTYADFELIIINDCSTDKTENIIKQLAETDSRIVYLKNEHNIGAARSRNNGIEAASGKWIAFLDSDDLWREDKLQIQMDFIGKHPNALLTYTASSFIDADGKPYTYIMHAQHEIDYKTLLKKNLISCSSVIVDSQLMRSVKMANDNMHEDYSAWLLMLKHLPCAYGIDEPLLIYRLSQNSKSSNRLKSAKMIFNSYRYVGYSVVAAGFFTFRYTFYSLSKRHRIYN